MEKMRVGSRELDVFEGKYEAHGPYQIYGDFICYDFIRLNGQIIKSVRIPSDLTTFMDLGKTYKFFSKKQGGVHFVLGVDDGAKKYTSYSLGENKGVLWVIHKL